MQVAGAHSGQEDGAETVSSQPQQGVVFCICGHSGLVLPVGRLLSCVPTWTRLYIMHLAVSLLHSRPEHVISESGTCACRSLGFCRMGSPRPLAITLSRALVLIYSTKVPSVPKGW